MWTSDGVGDPDSPTGSQTPGARGLPAAAATGTLPDDGDLEWQGGASPPFGCSVHQSDRVPSVAVDADPADDGGAADP